MQSTIKQLLEENGIQFVNRSYGMATTGPITLATLEKVEKALMSKVLDDVLNASYDVIDSLEDAERSGACSVKEMILKKFNN